MHNLLKRQLKKCFGDTSTLPNDWQNFIEAVNSAYMQFDAERTMLERSLELSSQELLQANSEMRALILAFPDLLFRTDATGAILDFKTGSKTNLYLPYKDLIGKRIQDIPLKDVSAQFQEAISRVQMTQAIASIEYALMIQGHEHYYEARLLPLLENQIMIIVRNISDRKKGEKALRESEEKYRSLIENVNIGIYRHLFTPDDRFVQANPSMLKIFGYDSIDAFTGSTMSDLFTDSDETLLFAEEIRQKGCVKDREMRLKRKDGTQIWASVTANAQFDKNRNIAWIDGVLEDITERKRLEEQLLQAHKMEAIGTLAGGIAHDFNNILTAIMGFASILKTTLIEDAYSRDCVHEILASSEKAAELTKNLLAFSRKQVISPKPADINLIIQKVETLLLRIIGEDIELKTVPAAETLTVLADSGQIEQVLMNLAGNARDSMPDGGILTIGAERIELDKEFIHTYGYGRPGLYAAITIEDTGSGMDERTRERIFEPFFTTKDIGRGTGLGLAMVYGIVKQHEGYINVYSEPGKGTRFRIYLPLIPSERVESAPGSPYTPPRGGTETILLAEDNSSVRKITKGILERSGYQVIEASDGEEAVSKFLSHKDIIQMLVLDIIMPKKSGKDVYDLIKQIRPDIRAVFMSGYASDIIHKKIILEESTAYITKPVLPDKLLRTVREILDK